MLFFLRSMSDTLFLYCCQANTFHGSRSVLQSDEDAARWIIEKGRLSRSVTRNRGGSASFDKAGQVGLSARRSELVPSKNASALPDARSRRGVNAAAVTDNRRRDADFTGLIPPWKPDSFQLALVLNRTRVLA